MADEIVSPSNEENRSQEATDPLLTTDLKSLQESNEKQMILKILEETRYNKSKTAKMLNIDRKTLYNKLTKYEIEV